MPQAKVADVRREGASGAREDTRRRPERREVAARGTRGREHRTWHPRARAADCGRPTGSRHSDERARGRDRSPRGSVATEARRARPQGSGGTKGEGAGAPPPKCERGGGPRERRESKAERTGGHAR